MEEFPGGPVVKTLHFQPPLVLEFRSHKQRGQKVKRGWGVVAL